MDDSPLPIGGPAAAERPLDLRSGIDRLATELRRTSGAWRLPSTWRTTANLPLWLACAAARMCAAVAGSIGSAVRTTGDREDGAGRGGSPVLSLLAEVGALDRRRIARASGARIPPLVDPDSALRAPVASP